MTAIAFLVGCSGASPEKLAKFQSGKTTLAEVVDALGSPDRDELLPDGSRMLVYLNQSAHTKIMNFVPVGNSFAGGWSVSSAEAGLMFTPSGILRFHAWSGDDQKRMKVTGQALSPHTPKAPPAEAAPQKQDPPPVAGQGAETHQPHAAD
ncbi:MAG: hypothetical protein HY055_02480 [Magnetospirillum sp.]|nr:hypothetical protein [Magnetospirillum sp.]